MAIVINGSGTVTGLAVGGLPDGTVDSGTLATDSVTAAKLEASAITVGDLPAGSVIQVVQTTGTSQTLPSTSFSACTPTVTITPSSSSSKILVRFNMGGMALGSINDIRLQIKRGSTVIKLSTRYGYCNTSTWTPCPITYEVLDSPSTTSATTYTLEAMKQSGGTLEINSSGGTNSGTAIATEIKG